MAKVFEDEFTEVQSGLISLCMELLRIGKQEMDQVYVYCNLRPMGTSFDAFFVKNDRVVMKEKIGAPAWTVLDFLKIGVKDTDKFRQVCKAHGKTVPAEMKMIYHIRTGQFEAEYGYEEKTCIDKSAGELFDDWTEEVQRSLDGTYLGADSNSGGDWRKPKNNEPKDTLRPKNDEPKDTPISEIWNKLYADLRGGRIGEYFEESSARFMEEIRFADLILPTGKIVGNDPVMMFETEPYLGKVQSGKYPVYLYILHENEDRRVAFAEIRFTENQPVTFRLARTEKNKDEVLGEGEYLGYGVDSGTGGFMDASVAEVIGNYNQKERQAHFDRLDELLENSYVHTYSTASYTPNGAKGNVVAFSSGYGDGGYGSYWGYDKKDGLCCLLTDFGTIYVE